MSSSDLIAWILPDALRHNLAVIRETIGAGPEICVAVKADAYGHGANLVLPVLREAGISRVATATLDEALAVRSMGWSDRILWFGSGITSAHGRERAERVGLAVRHGIDLTPISEAELRRIEEVAAGENTLARVHVNVETGMGRLGVAAEDALALCRTADRMNRITLEGVYTHLATADEADLTYAREQLTRFEAFLCELRTADVRPSCIHAANSAAALRLPESRYDLVRAGLAVYGYRPAEILPETVALRPTMRLTARISLIKTLPPGAGIGYGKTFVTQRESRVAVVPIGYNDGYRRSLSNRAVMTIDDKPAPVLGRVSMDQTTLDVTNIPEARVGTEVTVIDERPDRPNSVEALAGLLETIPYEVTCLIGSRAERRILDPNKG